MNKRKSGFFIGALIFFAVIGLFGTFFKDPAAFIQNIAIAVLIGLVIYYIYRRITAANPAKKEQRAFLKAARKSKKRNGNKNTQQQGKNSFHGTLASLKRPKKKAQAHLTVIEGKKGKKKDRASF
ncbi:hypothetical protein AM500_09380 [Bacillus sp. FJAT-18017]|uniref:SA1362 family protein n=1 Tax=Bacillus sp. FJAT-18017 TaxID=1705566 RepID=UPI0006AE5139|nr:SA1362 family protein [Bacillus sp. FJAT-18017]ALC89962.1 hypothetical protein AM500_09380 [Bacillus sp. FJAT-18017]